MAALKDSTESLSTALLVE